MYLTIYPAIVFAFRAGAFGGRPKTAWAGLGDFVADIARLTQIIAPEVHALGFALVRVAVFGKTEVGDEEVTLQVMAEDPATGQLLLDECAALSHRISDALDAREDAGEVLIEEAYRLEVSSPGIDRPLTRLKDFADWAGHEAKVSLNQPIANDPWGNRKALQGVLAGIEGENILLDDKKSGRVAFAFPHVQAAKLVLTDRLIAATKPLDPRGADAFETTAESTKTQES